MEPLPAELGRLEVGSIKDKGSAVEYSGIHVEHGGSLSKRKRGQPQW